MADQVPTHFRKVPVMTHAMNSITGPNKENEWLVWLDADIVMTNPSIRFEDMLKASYNEWREAVIRGGKTPGTEVPHLLVANTHVGINNGVFALRNTEWSRRFLRRWWRDRVANDHVVDNGPFMASLLREFAEGAGVPFHDECSKRVNPHNAGWGGLWPCYRGYLRHLQSTGNSWVSMCPRQPVTSSQSRAQVGDEEASTTHDVGGKILASCDINSGIGFSGANAYTDESLLVHFAGRSNAERNVVMTEYAQKFAHRFTPPCDYSSIRR
jgi:hypothetical protein